MLKLPIGIEDFKKIRDENYYYIDKTKFIEELLEDGTEVKLFCRPRRFGKTLNMSLLKYFFDIKNSQENRRLFNGLYIEQTPFINNQGKYPIIFLTLKDMKALNFEELILKVRALLRELYNQFEFIRENLNKSELEEFDEFWLGRDVLDLSKGLKSLSIFLEKYYNRKTILLIDEYDSPLLAAYEKGYYTEALSFFKSFYGNVLKTNSSLYMGVLTGIIKITQAGIFSDLNNIENYTILKKAYSHSFGLLESEVEEILQDYKIDYKIDEVKTWYNGYNFAGTKVYNPLSILKYTKEKELAPYWINTSGNDLILNILANSDESMLEDLNLLFNEKELETYIDLEIDVTRELIDSNIWSLMLSAGYLTIKEKIERNIYIIKIPNREIKTFFKESFIQMVFRGVKYIEQVKKALLSKNLNLFESSFRQLVLESISFYNTKNKGVEFNEVPYQMFMLGFLTSIQDKFFVTPEQESGLGRADIILEPKNKNGIGYILEIKAVKKESKMIPKAKEAYKQIIDKKYDTELRRRGVREIIKIGITFKGKEVKFSY